MGRGYNIFPLNICLDVVISLLSSVELKLNGILYVSGPCMVGLGADLRLSVSIYGPSFCTKSCTTGTGRPLSAAFWPIELVTLVSLISTI